MSISPDTLLQVPPHTITCKPLREGAKTVHKKREDAQKASRDLTHHEQVEIEKAKQEEVERAVAAERAGRAAPKARTATAQAQRRREELDFNLRVKAESLKQAHKDFAALCDEHGDTFAAEVASALESSHAAFREDVSQVVASYTDLEAAASIARTVLGQAPNVGAVSFPAKMIHELEIAPGQHNPRGVLLVPDLLAALGQAGMAPEPSAQEPAEPAPPPLRGVGLNASNTREHLERKALAQAMTANPTPDERPTLADDAVTAITPAELAASRRDLAGDNDE